MLSLGSERLHRRIDDALRQRGNAALGWSLNVEDADFSEDLKAGGYNHEDGPAATLDVDVGGSLSEDLEGRSAEVEWYVRDERGSIPVPAFVGELTDVAVGITTTRLEALTPGAYLDTTELGSYTQYGGVNPSTAVHDALLRAAYPPGLVRVEVITEPKFVRQGMDAYSATDFAGDVVEAVRSELPSLAHYDTADGGCRALREATLETPAGVTPVWTFEVGVDVPGDSFDDGRPSSAFREVVVRRQKTNPQPGVDPWEVLRRIEVPGSTAPWGTVKRIDVSDGAVDLEPFFRLAHEEVMRAAYGRGEISFECLYVHPRLERGDLVAVHRPRRIAGEEFVERWLCVLRRADCPEIRRKRGHYAGKARMVETIRRGEARRRRRRRG